jgi:hypothetical protein
MSARFLAAGLIASTVWYVLGGHSSGLSIGAISLRVMFWSFLAACIGKIIGIVSNFGYRGRN